MAFDIIGAKNAGYSDTEIADYLSSQNGFDAAGARKAGYSDQEIIGHVSGGVDVGAEAPTPPRIFSTPSKGTQQDVMGIASPKDRQAAETAQAFVKNDIPAVAKTFGAKIGGGMEQSIGGAMRAYGEENTNRFNVDDSQLAQTRAGRYLNDLTAADNEQRAEIAQRGTELGNEGRAVIQAAQEDQPVQTRAGRILDQTAQSIGSNLPGMAATMVTGSPAVGLSMMGLQSFGQTYDESRAKGLNIADATMNAAIQGGAEVATEMLPFVALSKYLKTDHLSKEVLKHYLSDIPGEHLATAIQNASDAAYDTADMTPQQRIDAAADYLASNKHKEDQIDTFFTTVLQGAVMGGVAKVARVGNALAPEAQPAPQPAPSGPLSRAVGMAGPAMIGPPEAVEPVQGVADIVAQRRGGDKSAAKRRFVGTPAPVVPAMAENQGIAPVVANMPELQGSADAQISPVAGLSEPVDTSVSPTTSGVEGSTDNSANDLPEGWVRASWDGEPIAPGEQTASRNEAKEPLIWSADPKTRRHDFYHADEIVKGKAVLTDYSPKEPWVQENINRAKARVAATKGVSNETADEGRQDDRQYAQGTESNADGEGQGRYEAALQTVQRYEDAQNETGVTPAPLNEPKIEAPAPVGEEAALAAKFSFDSPHAGPILAKPVLDGRRISTEELRDLVDRPTFSDELDNLVHVPTDTSVLRQPSNAANSKTPPLERHSEGMTGDVQLLRDTLRSKPFVEKGYSGVDVETQGAVQAAMLRIANNPQVLDTVVKLIPVDVMNMLRREKLTPEMVFHDPAVLKHTLSADLGEDVPVVVNIADSLVKALTLAGAVVDTRLVPSSTGSSAGQPIHRLTARGTDDRNTRDSLASGGAGAGAKKVTASVSGDSGRGFENRPPTGSTAKGSFHNGNVSRYGEDVNAFVKPEELTFQRVQDAFPNQKVAEENGVFIVTTPSGIPVRISTVGEIEFGPEQRAAAEKEYGRPLRDDERPVAEFKPLDHGALINLTEKGVGELSHEVFHLAMNLALTERQKQAVLRTFGNEEKAAAEYQRLKESGALETRKGNYWLSKIYRFLRSLRQLISPTAKGVMEDVASGKVWGKAHKGDGGARYAAAWHGSPHDHDKFTTAKIGTGEGAQAYGWGLYFAGNKEVAEHYRKTLSGLVPEGWANKYPESARGYIRGMVGDVMNGVETAERAAKLIQNANANMRDYPRDQLAKELDDAAKYAKGRLYQVELAPSEDEYLLWDKPLSEQSEKVKAALATEIDGMRQLYGGKSDPTRMTGAEFYKGLDGTPQEASEYLHSLGVRGIKYLDGTSRNNGGYRVTWGNGKKSNDTFKSKEDATFLAETYEEDYGKATIAWEDDPTANHNYVIFSDSDVEIKAKYSLRSAFTDHNPAALKSSLTFHPKVQALVGSVFNNGRNVSPWMRTVGTMYHMAEKLAAEGKPQFKTVFDKGQEFLTDVSTLALKAESLAPDIFPKMGTGKGLFHNLPRKDAIAIAEPLYQGTLFGGADPKKGKVFSDTELKRIFNLSDHQIELYKQARAATDQSLDDMAKSLIARNAKEAQVGFDREMDLADMAAEVKSAIQDKIDTMKAALDQLEDDFKNTPPDPDAKAQKKAEKAHNRAVSTQEAAIELHESFIANVENLAYKTDLLKRRGYFPLMRFGQYTVTMKDHSGKVEFFGLYESAYKARLMTDALQKENPGMSVVQSVMGREKFKLFAGMNLEGLQLFAEHMKAEDSEAYQEYLKQAMNNRSAMKRLIHRKGTEGYSEDAVRTLANFITSNARHASTQYHLHDMRKLASDVPEDTQGDVQDQAVKLYEYLSKPAEEASKLRGYLFFHYLGGSLASGIVNMTQPVMMTMPYLASKTTAAKAAKHLTKASKMSFTDPAKVGGELGVALRRAESEGVTAPQEIYQLTAMASNKLLAANPYWNAGMKAWGGFFSVAEAFNRRVTFIASYRISREKGLSPDRAYTEAVKAITETQGIYNKGNRPKWGRGTVGGTLFTFKQFSVMYLELFNRLPAKQKGIMLGILWLMAGLQGMPFAEDAEDIIDTIGQWAGFATNSKRWINQQAEDALGKDAGDFVTQGISSVLPLDLQGRMGLQNLIPGTGILKQSATDKGRDVKEFFGPAGGLLASLGDALTLAAQGLPGRAALAASPRAVQNIAQGVEMMATGAGHDKYGRKTVELSPGESAMKLTGFNPSRVAEEGQVKSANMQDVNLLRVRKNEISTQWAYGIAHKDSGEIAEAKKKLLEWNAKNPELKMNMGSVVQSARQKARALNTTGKDRFLKSMPKEIRRRVIDELG